MPIKRRIIGPQHQSGNPGRISYKGKNRPDANRPVRKNVENLQNRNYWTEAPSW